MAHLRLLHWRAAEAEGLLHKLGKAGHSVDYHEEFSTGLMRQWRKTPPDAFVIDLSRLPSQGKEIAIAIRQSPSTRQTPIVFCQGDEQKVATLRALMPDAVFSGAAELVKSVAAALKDQPTQAKVPAAMMDRYGGRTIAQKLGLKEGSKLACIDPPPHIEGALGELPAAVEFVEGDADVTLCFLHDPDSLRQVFSQMRDRADTTKLWMLWHKKTSSGHRGITEPAVRETGLCLGLVDYKICSVDKNWSAMLFARKKR